MSNVTLLDSTSTPGIPDIQYVEGNTGGQVGANPGTFTVNFIGDTVQGVSVNGNPGTFTETITVADATTAQKGVVLLPENVIALNYVNVTNAMSPYVVLDDDYFISCDATAGAITIQLPDTTDFKRQLVVKDRVGIASTNPISVTTVSGIVTIDGATTVNFTDNYESLELLFNSSTYETF